MAGAERAAARSVTAMVVGSGALFGVFSFQSARTTSERNDLHQLTEITFIMAIPMDHVMTIGADEHEIV